MQSIVAFVSETSAAAGSTQSPRASRVNMNCTILKRTLSSFEGDSGARKKTTENTRRMCQVYPTKYRLLQENREVLTNLSHTCTLQVDKWMLVCQCNRPYCSNTETKLSVLRCFKVSHMILLEMPAAPQQGACGSGSPNSYLKAHQRDVKQRC